MALQQPQLKEMTENCTSRETFRRRLSSYIMGLLIGVVLVAMMLWAKAQWMQKQGQGEGESGQAVEHRLPAGPSGSD